MSGVVRNRYDHRLDNPCVKVWILQLDYLLDFIDPLMFFGTHVFLSEGFGAHSSTMVSLAIGGDMYISISK